MLTADAGSYGSRATRQPIAAAAKIRNKTENIQAYRFNRARRKAAVVNCSLYTIVAFIGPTLKEKRMGPPLGVTTFSDTVGFS